MVSRLEPRALQVVGPGVFAKHAYVVAGDLELGRSNIGLAGSFGLDNVWSVRDLTKLPKAHLHVHLESTVRWPTLQEIGAANGLAVPSRPVLGSFAEFFAQNALVRECLQRPADFRRIALEFCADEAAQGTRYAEVSFTAVAHGERLGDLDMPLRAVLEGLEEGRREYGLETRLILDHSRRRPVEWAWQTVKLGKEYAAAGVVAVGLAGDEAFSGEPFEAVFASAVEAGLHVVHHAGEASGAESIRQAIHGGLTERLGHGIRVLDDPELVAEVRSLGLALEVCPSSNVALGFAPSLSEHPLPLLREAGLAVTLNTDIPSMIDTSPAREYELVRDAFGYGDEVLAELALAGVEASFAPAESKARLRAEIAAWLAAGS